jgi:hypothetical protein
MALRGRPKGVKNKRSLTVEMIAENFDIDPFEVLMMVAAGDWKGLGFESPTHTSFAASGIEFEELWIKLSDRVMAAKEASKYLYSQKKSVELSTGEQGFKIVIEDYGVPTKK